MIRMLVVGCGGSGGATLSFMMDQLRSDLAEHGIDKIPAGFQFIHLDVPTAPTQDSDGPGTVRDQGGVYYGTGTQSDSYEVLDNAVSKQFLDNRALESIATWAPRRPSEIRIPISKGAGQYRALGRMITLSKAESVQAVLNNSWKKLFSPDTTAEMSELQIPGAGEFDQADDPIILVISSMAGGAGASMALDVCRILTTIRNVNPTLMGVFMVAPDIFDGLPKDKVTGVRPNALAMLGEIVASQTGAAREHDVSTLRALGPQNGVGAITPFARVFPVGGKVGREGAVFGDGSQNTVYRGLGRGLAALMLSGPATQQFVEWDLGNAGSIAGDRSYLGWGQQDWNALPWGSFGFASLSMGRDRYAEYAAQRLARSAADKLVDGHLQSSNSASSDDQAEAVLTAQWANVCRQLGLPVSHAGADQWHNDVANWVSSTVLPADQALTLANQVVDTELRGFVPEGKGLNAATWVSSLTSAMTGRRTALFSAAQYAAYGSAYRWQRDFVDRLEKTVAEAISELGMVYATAMVKRVSLHIQNTVQPTTEGLGRRGPSDVADLPVDVRATLGALRGTLSSVSEIVASLLHGSARTVEHQIYASVAGNVSDALSALIPEIFDPLIAALGEGQRLLRANIEDKGRQAGVARLTTDLYSDWPADHEERVSTRFAEANNEVTLTSSHDFKEQYEVDLPAAVGIDQSGRAQFGQAVPTAAGIVISGLWPTLDGTRAPGEEIPLLERAATWHSRAFLQDPSTGRSIISSMARYEIHVRPAELLARARKFVARRDRSFDQFCSVTLQQFVLGTGSNRPVNESELGPRRADLKSKFTRAIQLARPLSAVDNTALQAVHGEGLKYRYKFSSIPFAGTAIADDFKALLTANRDIDEDNVNILVNAMTDSDDVKKVDIFGSYQNYSPLVFTSVIEPAKQQWSTSNESTRQQFWTMRRSRPLAASLPMHELERRTMVAGWILGQILGRIHLPEAPYDTPAKIWDDSTSEWVEFPHPLLTPPSAFAYRYNWLPAILESSLLAIAYCHEPPVMSSLRPYMTLRRIFDSTSSEPMVQGDMSQIAGAKSLTAWLRTGHTGTALASSVPDSGKGVSPADRIARIRVLLADNRDFAGEYFMEPGTGGEPGKPRAQGGGEFSQIKSRKVASDTPMFRDIAPDVFWAAGRLLDLVDQCESEALTAVPTDVPYNEPEQVAPQQVKQAPTGTRI